MKKYFFILSLFFLTLFLNAQPWNNPLKMAWSSDGQTFNSPTIFQDSSGVPSLIRWKGDTLVCAFQWFRQPNPSPTWDRVAVKFSYDKGLKWTSPIPISIPSLPNGYQRPFDPTLTVFSNDSIRIYFSSSAKPPLGPLDSTVNTYSAKSADGINYIFEQNARVDVATKQVIDPAVIYFNNSWHYAAPIGAPQQGAYHYLSPNGLNFNSVASIPSDALHNWTGNYMVNNSSELRFYGSGQNGIWYNSSPNGGTWNGYVNTNLLGGDPSCLKIDSANYLIIYVGQPYFTGLSDKNEFVNISIFPNPSDNFITVKNIQKFIGTNYSVKNILGQTIRYGKVDKEMFIIDLYDFSSGIYFLELNGKLLKFTKK